MSAPRKPKQRGRKPNRHATRKIAKTEGVFSEVTITPPMAPVAISPSLSDNENVQPAHISPTRGHEAFSGAFEIGMNALGFDTIHPQQSAVQRVVDSVDESGDNLYRMIAVEEPRRSGKSESLTALAVGRCLTRDSYKVAITFATTGTKLATRWKTDIFDRLERWSDRTGTDLVLMRSNGHEGVKFPNGSLILLLPPKGDAFRSEAFDLIIVDESGEASEAMTQQLLQAALPTMDTRPNAQLLVAGTPADFRAGNLLWQTEQAALDGTDGETGILKYGIAAELTLEDLETWEMVEPLVARSHPGVGTLTNMKAMERNYAILGPVRFSQEYLGQFGRDESTAGVINPAKWAACESTDTTFPELPAHFAVAFATSVDQAFAAAAVAWRSEDGKAHVALAEYKPGTSWLPAIINDFAADHPRIPIGHDSKGTVRAEAEKAVQARPRTRLYPQTWADVQTSAALFTREVHTGNLVHYGQPALTDAALTASRRGDERSFAFGRPVPNAQIVAVEAAAMALRLYDATPQVVRNLGIVM